LNEFIEWSIPVNYLVSPLRSEQKTEVDKRDQRDGEGNEISVAENRVVVEPKATGVKLTSSDNFFCSSTEE
jgi:hypothetical protein